MTEPEGRRELKYMADLDYSVVQQCIHCGMCLPSCPTYLETRQERNSPRGRIALMRAVADGDLDVTTEFGEEMYYCLGCLACTTACPAGVDYAKLFEHARAEIEHREVLSTPVRRFWRWLALRRLFAKPWMLRAAGRLLWVYQASGLCAVARKSGVLRLLPKNLRELEPATPTVKRHFSDRLIAEIETPQEKRHRVGMLTGCVQDLVFSDVNRDTVDVLLANGCEVVTPRSQGCCGSLHAHNGDIDQAAVQARSMIDQFDLDSLDAVITNAAGCGSHLKHLAHLLRNDPVYRDKARQWDAKARDVSEWLVEIGFRSPGAAGGEEPVRATYHEACHLCHGQGISAQPRQLLNAIPGLDMVELENATHCCGSAGVYNIVQPEQAAKLQREKAACIADTGARLVATANPGCQLQIQNGVGETAEVVHPVTLLARAYRREVG
ncbi:MAG: (Fe-S)-binding protein [Verrucomicrobiales bacterium]